MFRAAWNGMSRPRMIPGESAPTISMTIAPAMEIETAKRILATLTPEQAQARIKAQEGETRKGHRNHTVERGCEGVYGEECSAVPAESED